MLLDRRLGVDRAKRAVLTLTFALPALTRFALTRFSLTRFALTRFALTVCAFALTLCGFALALALTAFTLALTAFALTLTAFTLALTALSLTLTAFALALTACATVTCPTALPLAIAAGAIPPRRSVSRTQLDPWAQVRQALAVLLRPCFAYRVHGDRRGGSTAGTRRDHHQNTAREVSH